ncbi:baseplate J/gp47 family protein [Edwardsiella piscicida]|nr:baseplate J/gp47 family protein [Edwardsiella piscicida]ELM3730548.1 baseplate J/gp47 family protein [Edwardsiella piscicida]ELV7537975.1 baseplate J/gp47 family protein [Edwardsiella piscicida]
MISSVFNPQIDRISEPDVLEVEGFEVVLSRIKRLILERVSAMRPDDVDAVTETLENDAEIASIIAQACAMVVVNRERRLNDKIRQILLLWAKGSNLDARAAEFGITRQVVKAGNPDAYPPIPDQMESDIDLLTRCLLAPFGFATTGSELAYRFHLMTLGDKPAITVTSPLPNRVVMTYDFPEYSQAGEVKDGRAKMARAESGLVDCWLLARAGDGMPSDELISYANSYMNRPEVALVSDVITVKKPTIRRYAIRMKLHGSNSPGGIIDPSPIKAAMEAYAEGARQLEGIIDPGRLYAIAHGQQTVVRAELLEPTAPLVCAISEAPYCTQVSVEVVYD